MAMMMPVMRSDEKCQRERRIENKTKDDQRNFSGHIVTALWEMQ